MSVAVLLAVTVGALGGGVAVAAAGKPTLHFRVFANVDHHMDGLVWTGKQFVYVENTTNVLYTAPAQGTPVQQFATMPTLVEETRCVLSPGAHGFPAGVLFCHSPDDKIYEISADGKSVTVFATLPAAANVSDGALAFDDVGKLGYQLVAATGRSGAPQPSGGTVYTVSASGQVATVGSYAGPGGADQVMIAPASFGSVGGQALLTVDPGSSSGAVVAMDAAGATRTLATFDDGPDPIMAIPAASAQASTGPPAGVYVTNDINNDVYFAPATGLGAYAGDILVGTENHAEFWILKPHGNDFTKLKVRHTLRGGHYSLEGGIFIG